MLVTMGGNSNSASDTWSQFRTFGPVSNKVWAAVSGTVKTVPSYHGEWGQVQGQDEYQLAHVSIRWCRDGSCVTNCTPFLGEGSEAG